MVKVSNIYRWTIEILTVVMLGLYLMTPVEHIGSNIVKALVALAGIILCAISIFHSRLKSKHFNMALKYIVPYTLIIIFEALYTVITLDYSLNEILIASTPYLYVYLAFPIISIFISDKNTYDFLKSICRLVVIFLIIKSCLWYLYNFKGVAFFERLLFEFNEWIRDGQQRVNVGYLIGVLLSTYSYLAFRKKSRFALFYQIVIIGAVLFVTYITKMRFLMATFVVTEFIIIYFMSDKKNKRLAVRLVLIAITIFIITSDFFRNYIDSFSLSGALSWSTKARFLTISHYFELMKERNAFFGLGFLIVDNMNANVLLGTTLRYYLEDIGILGGLVRFGVLSIHIYGFLFFEALRISYMAYQTKKKSLSVLAIGLTAYMLISCMALNIFDLQRSFDVPFYIAILSYIDGCIEIDEDNLPCFAVRRTNRLYRW